MSFIFCYKSYHYEITAITECDKLSLQKVNVYLKKVKYKFRAVDINEPLNHFLSSLLYYLKNEIHCLHMHRAKTMELFIIFKFFYPADLHRITFYNLFNRNMSFMSLVINNRRKAKNVEELAYLSGYSICPDQEYIRILLCQ